MHQLLHLGAFGFEIPFRPFLNGGEGLLCETQKGFVVAAQRIRGERAEIVAERLFGLVQQLQLLVRVRALIFEASNQVRLVDTELANLHSGNLKLSFQRRYPRGHDLRRRPGVRLMPMRIRELPMHRLQRGAGLRLLHELPLQTLNPGVRGDPLRIRSCAPNHPGQADPEHSGNQRSHSQFQNHDGDPRMGSALAG